MFSNIIEKKEQNFCWGVHLDNHETKQLKNIARG